MAEILDAADRDGQEAYVESSPDGNALYQKMGFETVDRVVVSVPVDNNKEEENTVQYSTDLMVRRVREREALE
jgi:(2Fe-2S) ferredoxin